MYLASVVVDDKALVPVVEVGVGAQGRLELLEQGVIGTFSLGVHGGADVIQDAHEPWRILGKEGRIYA